MPGHIYTCAMPWVLQGWRGIVPEPPFFLFFPKWWIPKRYLQEECMGREVIIFNACFNTYCICSNLFLHHLILYFCNYFLISIDNIMTLLLITSLLLLYFFSSSRSLRRGTNMCFNIRLKASGASFSAKVNTTFPWFHVLLQKLFILKVFQSLDIYPFYALDASRTWALRASNCLEPDCHASLLTRKANGKKILPSTLIILKKTPQNRGIKPRRQKIFWGRK